MAAPQVAGAAALLLAAYAAGGANVTGRGLEVKALLLATVQRVPGMAHKVRGCIVAVTLTITPRPEGLSFVSVAQAPGSGSVPGGLLLRRRGARQSSPRSRCCCAWSRLGEGGAAHGAPSKAPQPPRVCVTAGIPVCGTRAGGELCRPELSCARQVASGGRLDAGRASISTCGAWVGARVGAELELTCVRQVASGGRLDVGRAMAALPADLSVFRGNPNAPLPYDASRAAAVPAFDPAVDPAVLDYQPTNPGAPLSAIGPRGCWARGARMRPGLERAGGTCSGRL